MRGGKLVLVLIFFLIILAQTMHNCGFLLKVFVVHEEIFNNEPCASIYIWIFGINSWYIQRGHFINLLIFRDIKEKQICEHINNNMKLFVQFDQQFCNILEEKNNLKKAHALRIKKKNWNNCL